MSTSMKKLRAAVFRRAAQLCECGCGRFITPESGHLDHFFGRAKVAESVKNCWALSITCDERKTRNFPSASFWLRRFIAHADKHSFAIEAEMARAKLQVLEAKGRAA